MSYTYRILNDRPRHFFPLVEGALAWNDSASSTVATVTGAPSLAPPLVVGGGNSYVMDGSNWIKFTSPVFYNDSPSRPFSLEAWFKPIDVTGPKGIVGHAGQNDGLYFDGEAICFATLHGAAGDAIARYYPSDTSAAFHVVGVHSEGKNELFVNGVLAAGVDLTEEQLLTDYEISTAPGSLYVGHLSGQIIVDSVAVYNKALTGRQATLHFLWGREAPALQEVVSRRGGDYWDFTDFGTDIALDFRFDTDAEWLDAQSASVRVVDDILTPDFAADGTTLAGTWIAGVILPAVVDTVGGSKVEFDGDGTFAVHTSIDNGTTWSPAINGREVTGLGQGTATAGKSLQVRVTFLAGEPADTITRVRHLSIKIYRSRDNRGSMSGKTVSLEGKVGLSSEQRQPIEQSDRMGVEFYDGGYAVLDSLSGYRTLEVWVKANSAQGATNDWWHIFDFRNADGTGDGYLARQTATANWSANGGTMYVNGKATNLNSDFAFTPGRWYHVVFVLTAATSNRLLINNNFTAIIGKPMSFGSFAAYPQVMTATEATELYNSHLGIPSRTIVEVSGLDIDDAPANTVKIYSYDWSNISSG